MGREEYWAARTSPQEGLVPEFEHQPPPAERQSGVSLRGSVPRPIAEAVLASGDRLLATARDPRQLADLVEKYGDQSLPELRF